jgi:hypothetical protein
MAKEKKEIIVKEVTIDKKALNLINCKLRKQYRKAGGIDGFDDATDKRKAKMAKIVKEAIDKESLKGLFNTLVASMDATLTIIRTVRSGDNAILATMLQELHKSSIFDEATGELLKQTNTMVEMELEGKSTIEAFLDTVVEQNDGDASLPILTYGTLVEASKIIRRDSKMLDEPYEPYLLSVTKVLVTLATAIIQNLITLEVIGAIAQDCKDITDPTELATESAKAITRVQNGENTITKVLVDLCGKKV